MKGSWQAGEITACDKQWGGGDFHHCFMGIVYQICPGLNVMTSALLYDVSLLYDNVDLVFCKCILFAFARQKSRNENETRLL